MSPLRILITSAYYAPELAGNAPYVTGLAEGLAERGHTVTVATGFPHYPQWRRRNRFQLLRNGMRNGVRVRRRWHYIPATHSAIHRGVYEATLFAGGLTAGWMRRPDVVIGVSPSLSGAALAATFARVYRRPYVMVIQDLVAPAALQSGYAGGASVAGGLARVELKLARDAAAVGIITAGFRDYLESGGVASEKLWRVRNWFLGHEPAEPPPAARRRLGWDEDAFVCLHAGNMGHKQGLSNLLQAAALVTDPAIRFVLAGDGNERARLEGEATDLGLANLSFRPGQPAGQYEAMLAAADLLLVNQLPSVTDMALPGKLTSYFAAGRPVVAAVSPQSETAREVAGAGGGVVVPAGDPPALAAAIMRLRNDATLAATLGGRGRRYAIEELRREAALDRYEEMIQAAAGRT